MDGEVNSARYPDVHRLDLRLDKRFVFNTWTLTAYLDLWNIYNRNNVISYKFSVDDHQKIIRSEQLDFGFLPIIGVTAQL